MKTIFTPDFFRQVVLQVVLGGILVFFLQSYYQNKWAPLTAAETLKNENFLNSQRDIYFQAIDILTRNLANINFTDSCGKPIDTSNRNRGGAYPTEVEVNSCYSKLCIYSNDKNIALTFRKLFRTNDNNMKPISEMSNFTNLVRKDLGYGEAIIDTTHDNYNFIVVYKKDN